MQRIKERRKALGWDRGELAERAAVPRSVIALMERDQWSEELSVARVEDVLTRAESGEADPRLAPPKVPR